MARKKVKDWKQANFSLDTETIKKLEDISNFEGVSKAQMIDFLVHNWDIGLDYNEKLKKLQSDKEEQQAKLAKIEEEINRTIKFLALMGDWNKNKISKKSEALKIIKRKLLNKEFEEAERISKTWQRICGVPSIELLIEAKDILLKEGI
jgi:hypothetical protein